MIPALLLVAQLAGPAVPTRAAVEVVAAQLVAAVDLAPALPERLERQLGNGLTNVVAVHVALLPADGAVPAALWAREIQVLYDVWEERFDVVARDASAPRGRRLAFATFAELRAWLVELRGVPLGPASALDGGRYVVQARVELNPVSKELLARTRELMANPSAGARGGPSRSVLGAIASYLLREPPPGAEVRVVRSAPFGVGEARGP